MHIGLLKTNLIGLFMVDELRRIGVESILPLLMQSKQLKDKIHKVENLLRKNTEVE